MNVSSLHRFALILTIAPYLALVGGQSLDTWSTLRTSPSGCYESNPFMGSAAPGRTIVTKGLVTLGIAGVMRLAVKQGHPRVAQVLGWVGGGVGAGAGVFNLTHTCGGR